MKMKKLRMLLLATLALCACSSGGDGAGDSPGVPNPPTGDKRQPINIGMTVNDRENTRVTDLAFEVGDQIGLFVVNRNADGTAQALKTTGNHVDNMRFTYNATWTPDAPIYWLDDKTNADFYIYLLARRQDQRGFLHILSLYGYRGRRGCHAFQRKRRPERGGGLQGW